MPTGNQGQSLRLLLGRITSMVTNRWHKGLANGKEERHDFD